MTTVLELAYNKFELGQRALAISTHVFNLKVISCYPSKSILAAAITRMRNNLCPTLQKNSMDCARQSLT